MRPHRVFISPRAIGLVCFSLGTFTSACIATVTLNPLFQDHAVLQRDKPVPIWGTASPREKISVAFSGQIIATTADAQGKWQVALAPLPANAQPQTLTVTAENTLVLHDILVGEVWLCSGQSNMHYPVELSEGANEETALTPDPLLRQIEIVQNTSLQRIETFSGKWAVCSPATVGKFSAVAHYFAKDLSRRLHVPVGIVHSSWGGTSIEAWLSADALLSSPAFQVVFDRWGRETASYPERHARYVEALATWTAARDEAKKAGRAFKEPAPTLRELNDRRLPTLLFNAMITPIKPVAVRGVLWYQGEDNTGRADEYQALLTMLIRSWRGEWHDDMLPFLVVQLPGCATDNAARANWARLREAQRQAALALPAVTLITTFDLGNPSTVHPKGKKAFGLRAATAAYGALYATSAEFSGPVIKTAKTADGKIALSFTHAEGLRLKSADASGFEIAGEEGAFHSATAELHDGIIVLTSPLVKHPVRARYAWADAPVVTLFNDAGLPASPFVIEAEAVATPVR